MMRQCFTAAWTRGSGLRSPSACEPRFRAGAYTESSFFFYLDSDKVGGFLGGGGIWTWRVARGPSGEPSGLSEQSTERSISVCSPSEFSWPDSLHWFGLVGTQAYLQVTGKKLSLYDARWTDCYFTARVVGGDCQSFIQAW